MKQNVLRPIQLDPRNERTLTQQAKQRALQSSGGSITSLNEGDPLDVLARTQAYLAAEFLFHVNGLPLQFVLRFLQLTGVVQSQGSRATVTCRFRLISAQPNPIRFEQGFVVTGQFKGRTYAYSLVEELIIPAGATEGFAVLQAEAIGKEYNLPVGIINQPFQPRAFLQSIINLEQAQGGTEPQSTEDVLEQAIGVLRRRSPISAVDFEEEAEAILGLGSRCKAIGRLGADKVTEEVAAVHLFLLSASMTPANNAEIAKVRTALTPRVQLGCRLHLSPIELIEINGEVIAQVEAGQEVETVADNLWAVFQQEIDPSQYPVGQSINPGELAHSLRFAGGIDFLEAVLVNNDTLPIPLPNQFTLPKANGLLCQLINSAGTVFTIVRGNYPSDPE